jgi:hypothetical protein
MALTQAQQQAIDDEIARQKKENFLVFVNPDAEPLLRQQLAAYYDQQNTGAKNGQVGGFGGQTWDEATQGYRDAGAAYQQRGALTLDQSQADKARAIQMGSLGLLRRQATGEAPSASEILSQRANEQGAQNMAEAGLHARGPGAAVAANGAAMRTGSLAMLGLNAQNAAQRAQEISRGQSGYSGSAGALRGQDIAAATSNAQLEAQQRALNEAAQQNYEQMAYDTRQAQLAQGNAKEANVQAANNAIRAENANTKQEDAQNLGTAAAVGAGIASAGTSLAATGAAGAAAAAAKAGSKPKRPPNG